MRVLILGTFDLLHEGHVAFLDWGRRVAGPDGSLIVGLNTDRFAESYKRRPVVPYEGRRKVIEAIRGVTHVWPNDQADGTIADLLDRFEPDAVIAPGDWYARDWYAQVGVPLEGFWQRGIAVVWVPATPGVSTTAIIERLAA